MTKPRIKQERKRHLKTLQDVADHFGLSNSAIAQYENGVREPRLEFWEELGKYLNVNVGWLQGTSDIRYSYTSSKNLVSQIVIHEFDDTDLQELITNYLKTHTGSHIGDKYNVFDEQ